MKECSKVWHKCKHPGDNISSKYTFYCGWKAALSWIYYDICPEVWDVGDVEFDIEQELNIAKSFQNSQKPLKDAEK